LTKIYREYSFITLSFYGYLCWKESIYIFRNFLGLERYHST